jgi:hypothetical protein
MRLVRKVRSVVMIRRVMKHIKQTRKAVVSAGLLSNEVDLLRA